eukprot:TRINITY_DN1217_c4_g1_i1.p2 TRINITY_DN1217_c4_g1~~TRINITY_DN1217_c4_g1_i1.p2  ORF type:complete len:118 (+),score=25.63 TRINITY_DN1217_c4_g1_i1:34-354(+)
MLPRMDTLFVLSLWVIGVVSNTGVMLESEGAKFLSNNNTPITNSTPFATPSEDGGDDSGMSMGVKVVIFLITYFLAIGMGIGGVKGYRHAQGDSETGMKKWFSFAK